MALPTDSQVQADFDAWTPPPDKNAAPHPMAAEAPPNPLLAATAPPPAKPTPTFLDSIVSTVDNYSSKLGEAVANDPLVRIVRQAAAGAIKGAVNQADALTSEDKGGPEQGNIGPDLFHPLYNDARQAALDFRDAIAVKDPSIPEHLVESAGQLMPSFLMFSRVLGSFGLGAEFVGGAKKAMDLAQFATADAATNATAIAPHDPRLADTFALHKDAEGKYVDLLNTVSPDGSLFHQYINYIADHKNETEAEGRWKNVLDGWNAAAALGGILHVGGSVLKQGWNALHYMADQNMGSLGDMMPKPQTGAIGTPTPAANNASAESAASKEAQNWVRAQKSSGIKRYRLEPDGTPQPMMGIEGRDPTPMTGRPVIDMHKDGTHEIIDRGGMTKMQADGLAERAKTLYGLGPKPEKPGA